MRLLLFNLATDSADPVLGFATRWIQALATRVECVQVLTMRAGSFVLPANVHVFSAGKERGYSELRRVIEFYRHLVRVLWTERIDACFSHMIPVFTVLAAPILKLRKIPLVTWYAHRQVTTTLKLAHQWSDRMVSINAHSYPCGHDKFVPLGHGIDTDLFSSAEHDSMEFLEPPLILSVGRLSPVKDQATLIKAISLVRQRGYAVRCALVGAAPEHDYLYARELRKMVERYGLTRVIEFVGSVSPQEQVVQWYRRCIAHVNCGQGAVDKAVLEAMACGRPSLSSNSGCQDTMGQWAELLSFQAGNAVDLAEKLIAVLSLSSVERKALGGYLRMQAVQMHNVERLTDKLLEVLREACRSGGTAWHTR
jgi:glycosyltransferase involved in cell wall biosynthesis